MVAITMKRRTGRMASGELQKERPGRERPGLAI